MTVELRREPTSALREAVPAEAERPAASGGSTLEDVHFDGGEKP